MPVYPVFHRFFSVPVFHKQTNVRAGLSFVSYLLIPVEDKKGRHYFLEVIVMMIKSSCRQERSTLLSGGHDEDDNIQVIMMMIKNSSI